MNMKKIILLLSIAIFININAFAFSTKAKYALVIDADTTSVIYQKNANVKMAPSSMSKLMTVYVVFTRLKEGSLKLDDKILISKKAWSKTGSKMFVPLNEEVTVDELLRGVIIQSGNDASIALAEGVAGSEEAFAARMNIVAKQIGLTGSHFVNATGWPHKDHYMTAQDLAVLTKRIINDHPEYYSYFSEKEFVYNKIRQGNRNTLLGSHIGVDGLKTGHTDAAGYSITSSAKQGNRRLIAVVNGLNSEQDRAAETQKLLQYGFLNFTNVTVAKANEPIALAKVWLGNKDAINLVCDKDLVFTVPVEQKDHVEVIASYEGKLSAPLQKNTKVGTIEVRIPNQETKYFDIATSDDVSKAGFVQRAYYRSKQWLQNIGSSSQNQVENKKSAVLAIH